MTAAALKFISEIELPTTELPWKRSEETRLIRSTTGDAESAQVNLGSLTSFTQNLSGRQKEDVQNSTLLAQLASNKVFDRFKKPMEWYANYTNVLSKVGWIIPAFNFDTFKPSGSQVRIYDVVLDLVSTIASGIEVKLVARTMDALEAQSDASKQMTIWDASAASKDKGNFQIFPVDALGNGDIVMILSGMQFDVSSVHSRFLWWTWQSQTIRLQRAVTKCVLNEQIYAKVRQAVIDKLGNSANDFVAGLEI